MKLGEAVKHVNLTRLGRIVSEVRNGKCLVEFGNVTMRCRVNELSSVEAFSKVNKQSNGAKAHSFSRHGKVAKKDLYLCDDFHGLRVPEALERVEQLLNQAVMENYAGLRIIHGIGQGRLREALHNYLGVSKVVANYKYDINNHGITIVHLY